MGPRFRLLLTATLFAAWIGWLAYLAFATANPVVLSRSQVMAATHFVLADLTVDAKTGRIRPTVVVRQDLRPTGQPITGEIAVGNFKEARVAGAASFEEPGPYLLMLVRGREGYELALPARTVGGDALQRGAPWVYRWEAPGVQRQLDELAPTK